MQIMKSPEADHNAKLILGYKGDAGTEESQALNGIDEADSGRNSINCQENYQPSKEGLTALKRAEEKNKTMQADKKDDKNPYEDDIKALKIAQNIMRGKIVPAQDERFLIEHNLKMYQAAKNIASMKEQTEKVKSELDDDEDKSKALRDLNRDLWGNDQTEGTEETNVSAGEVSVEEASASE